MRINRKSILDKINEIERIHCDGCQLKHEKENRQKSCAAFCEIGREIVEIARPLTKEKRTAKQMAEQNKKSGSYGSKTKVIMDLYDQGKGPTEILNITGFSKGTVDSTIYRVRKQRKRKGAGA